MVTAAALTFFFSHANFASLSAAHDTDQLDLVLVVDLLAVCHDRAVADDHDRLGVDLELLEEL